MNEKRVYTFGNGKAEGRADMRNLLGGKGANLAEMNLIGVPVPPGFTITTDVCNEYFEKGKADVVSLLKNDVEKSISHIEGLMGLRFGDAENPLLVSVRSGARASMPGMMDTILNLGLNDKVVVGLAKKTGNERFAYDSYRRFVQMYGDVVLGMKPVNKDDIDPFEAIIDSVKAKRGIVLDNEMNVEELKELVSLFKAAIKERTGEVFPENPVDQLWGAICAVFDSWMNERAILYRKMEGIPQEWGTAVTVMAMVFGNMGNSSATGVCFSRDAATGEIASTVSILSMHRVRMWLPVFALHSRSQKTALCAGRSSKAYPRRFARQNSLQWKRPCQRYMVSSTLCRISSRSITTTCKTWSSPCRKVSCGFFRHVTVSARARQW